MSRASSRETKFVNRDQYTKRFTVRLVLLALCCWTAPASAHNPALDPPEPGSVPEAWNVITQCSANVQTLIDTNQLREIAYQIANTTPAIRLLKSRIGEMKDAEKVSTALDRMSNAGAAVIIAARQPNDPRNSALDAYHNLQDAVKSAAAFYPPEVVNAAVYICPMHPKDRHLNSDERCSLCKMPLIKRRIVASSIYEKPGESSIVMSAEPDKSVQQGKSSRVTIRLSRRDGSPVLPGDLLVMHTQRIHLLIVDQTLADYHHEHPTATDTPGEYIFTFSPSKPGAYRIFADVVPAASCIQEYVVADLKSDSAGGQIDDRATELKTTLDEMQFKLSFDPKALPLRAGEPVLGELTVTAADGKPYRGLEPVMGAFGHFVGFNEDHATVVHVHPAGVEPTDPKQRGGPTLPFFLYAPKPGYMRFYAQVRVEGVDRFVPFGLNIAEAGQR